MTTEKSNNSLIVARLGCVIGVLLALVVFLLPSEWLAGMDPLAQVTDEDETQKEV